MEEAGMLEYGRAEVALRRPWYVWVGAGMATLWLAAVGAASLYAMVSVLMSRAGGDVPWVLVLIVLSLVCLLVAMLLVLEWRAVFRRSANAAAMVGLLLAFPTLLACFAEVRAFAHHERMAAVAGLGVVASSLGFCAWSHFQWARVVAKWLTRSLEAVPTRGRG